MTAFKSNGNVLGHVESDEEPGDVLVAGLPREPPRAHAAVLVDGVLPRQDPLLQPRLDHLRLVQPHFC